MPGTQQVPVTDGQVYRLPSAKAVSSIVVCDLAEGHECEAVGMEPGWSGCHCHTRALWCSEFHGGGCGPAGFMAPDSATHLPTHSFTYSFTHQAKVELGQTMRESQRVR